MVTPKQIIAPTELTDAALVYYTVPQNTTAILKKLTFANFTAGAVTVTVWFNGSNNAHIVLPPKTLAPGESYEAFTAENHNLPAGSTIQLACSANTAVTVVGSALEVV